MSSKERRDYITKRREESKIAKENTILKQQESLIDDSKKEAERVQTTEKDRIDEDKQTLLETKAKNQETINKYFNDSIEEENRYFNEYESEQNRLLSE